MNENYIKQRNKPEFGQNKNNKIIEYIRTQEEELQNGRKKILSTKKILR